MQTKKLKEYILCHAVTGILLLALFLLTLACQPKCEDNRSCLPKRARCLSKENSDDYDDLKGDSIAQYQSMSKTKQLLGTVVTEFWLKNT